MKRLPRPLRPLPDEGQAGGPGRVGAAGDAAPVPVLDVRGLETQFFTDDGIVRAVDGVSFSVARGETLGIVGESGSGKTVAALSLMRLTEEPCRITGGEIRFQDRDVLRMTPDELRAYRGGGVAMVFQNPMTSLNPVLRIARQLVETMVVHGRYDMGAATARSVNLLGRMGITAPERAIRSYPHQFSGGMRQRVVIAMGMSNEPALLIADEPTTALDVTIQAQILELLRELNDHFGTAIVLISHDLGVIARVCSRVLVMYAGEVVEEGPTEALLADPRHPYTWALINAVPRLDGNAAAGKRLTTIEGTPPDPLSLPRGCRFFDRCPFRIARCAEHPPLADIGNGRKTRCWLTQAGGTLAQASSAITQAGAAMTQAGGVPLQAGGAPTPAVGTDERPPASGANGASAARVDGDGAQVDGDSAQVAHGVQGAHGVPGGHVGAVAAAATSRFGQGRASVRARGERLLEVRGLTKHFPLPRDRHFGPQRVVHAVDGVDLDVAQGETVGLVGESGCGKSTLARVIVRIHEPTAGSIVFAGEEIGNASAAQIRPLRRRMQMVFQDPYSSLNPRMSVREILGEPMRFHGLAQGPEVDTRIAELLDVVGLSRKSATRYPHEFSGGQRQRISIARALAVRPDFIIADEPISALDVNIQAQIINLLIDLQERFGLTYLFIAHDLAVVRHISDRIVVLYLGKVMETAPAHSLFTAPLHPYTRHLISAVPVPDVALERQRRHLRLAGEPPSAVDPPSGCRFRTRCPIAQKICADQAPPLVEHATGHRVACHFPGAF